MSVTLTDKEATVFAYRVALQQLAASDMWLDWEDYQNLTDHAFNDMDRHVQVTIPNYLRSALRLMEDTWDIDGADLMEQAVALTPQGDTKQ